jgi:non-heme chloroperoxidase
LISRSATGTSTFLSRTELPPRPPSGPTLIIHGDDHQIVPIKASAHLVAEIVPNATLTVYLGGSHGLPETEAERFNADILSFIRA